MTIELTAPPPLLGLDEAAHYARDIFGIQGTAARLGGERDANFKISAEDGRAFILKFSHPDEDEAGIEAQIAAIQCLQASQAANIVQKVVLTTERTTGRKIALPDGRTSLVRMLTWLEGIPLHAAPPGKALSHDIGRSLGLVDLGLSTLKLSWQPEPIIWDMTRAARIRPLLQVLNDSWMRDLAASHLSHFEAETLPKAMAGRCQYIHNDLNPHNALVYEDAPTRLSGILDFGDMVHAPLIMDVAVSASYCVGIAGQGPLDLVVPLLEGYQQSNPLTRTEVALLRDLIVTRLILASVVTMSRAARHPEHADYILRNLERTRDGLRAIISVPQFEVTEILLKTCVEGEAA